MTDTKCDEQLQNIIEQNKIIMEQLNTQSKSIKKLEINARITPAHHINGLVRDSIIINGNIASDDKEFLKIMTGEKNHLIFKKPLDSDVKTICTDTDNDVDTQKSDTLESQKESIVKFFINTCDKKGYRRMMRFAAVRKESTTFKSYEHFLKHNKKCINKLDNDAIMFLLVLMKKIHNGSINHCDEEQFIEYSADAFYFNFEEDLVIMHQHEYPDSEATDSENDDSDSEHDNDSKKSLKPTIITISQKKESIMAFITKTFCKYTYKRMMEFHEDRNDEDESFESYKHFLKHNNTCVQSLNEDDVTLLILLIKKIEKETISQCDEEHFIEFTSSSFYFTFDKQLVLMNSR